MLITRERYRSETVTSRPTKHACPGCAAFTLIELLTVITIIGILAAIVIPTVAACRKQAYKAREVSAARQLMTAYMVAADENRGVLMKGYDGDGKATSEGGGDVSMNEPNHRWPHRLRPYLGDRFKAVLYINEQAERYDEVVAENPSGGMKDYYLSLGPSFGMNTRFVGGDSSSELIEDDPVTRVEQASLPQGLIVFCSAANRALDLKSGYWQLQASVYWAGSEDIMGVPDDPAKDGEYGYISYRLGGRAAVTFLDGHVSLMSCSQLRDMRLWSEVARVNDDPTHRPGAKY